jgi:hypothetical protein
MVDPISSQAVSSIAGNNGVAQPADISKLGGANPQDVQDFAAAMNNQPLEAPMPPADIQAAQGVQKGDMLTGLDDLSSNVRDMQSNMQGVADALGGDMGNLLRTQFQVAHLTMTQTMIGQVGQKTSQGTQQLLKGQ